MYHYRQRCSVNVESVDKQRGLDMLAGSPAYGIDKTLQAVMMC